MLFDPLCFLTTDFNDGYSVIKQLVGHYGYEGVQNDSIRYCDTTLKWTLKEYGHAYIGIQGECVFIKPQPKGDVKAKDEFMSVIDSYGTYPNRQKLYNKKRMPTVTKVEIDCGRIYAKIGCNGYVYFDNLTRLEKLAVVEFIELTLKRIK